MAGVTLISGTPCSTLDSHVQLRCHTDSAVWQPSKQILNSCLTYWSSTILFNKFTYDKLYKSCINFHLQIEHPFFFNKHLKNYLESTSDFARSIASIKYLLCVITYWPLVWCHSIWCCNFWDLGIIWLG